MLKQVRVMRQGFTLVEILVVVSILALIAGIIIARYRDFDSVTLLQSLAYDVALSIREAQVLGVGVRGEGGSFEPAYGVHFDLSSPEQYVLFRDADDDRVSGEDETVTNFSIGKGNRITEICIDADCSIESASVLFLRPDLDAIFVLDGSEITAEALRVTVASEKNPENKKVVRVSATGQVSVE